MNENPVEKEAKRKRGRKNKKTEIPRNEKEGEGEEIHERVTKNIESLCTPIPHINSQQPGYTSTPIPYVDDAYVDVNDTHQGEKEYDNDCDEIRYFEKRFSSFRPIDVLLPDCLTDITKEAKAIFENGKEVKDTKPQFECDYSPICLKEILLCELIRTIRLLSSTDKLQCENVKESCCIIKANISRWLVSYVRARVFGYMFYPFGMIPVKRKDVPVKKAQDNESDVIVISDNDDSMNDVPENETISFVKEIPKIFDVQSFIKSRINHTVIPEGVEDKYLHLVLPCLACLLRFGIAYMHRWVNKICLDMCSNTITMTKKKSIYELLRHGDKMVQTDMRDLCLLCMTVHPSLDTVEVTGRLETCKGTCRDEKTLGTINAICSTFVNCGLFAVSKFDRCGFSRVCQESLECTVQMYNKRPITRCIMCNAKK